MNARVWIACLVLLLGSACCRAQATSTELTDGKPASLARMCVYQGDTIPYVKLPTLYVFRPVRFKNKKQKKQYDKLVRDVKTVLPIAKEVRTIVIETYEYLQTLPDKKSRDRHIKAVEKGLKEQYTPRLKKLSLSQGKLLIKLVDRETRSTGYELVRAFMGSFKAAFYQTFASLFGASLKKAYDAEGDDILTEQIVLMVESGQL